LPAGQSSPVGNNKESKMEKLSLLPFIEDGDAQALPQPKRKRVVDHEAIPFQADVFGFIQHPENTENVGPAQAFQIHRVMFQHYMEDIRNEQVSESRRRAIWDWVLDTLCRWDEPVACGTFRACCIALETSTPEMLKTLIWTHRDEIDWLYGHGAYRKFYRRADDLIEPDEDHLCEEMGGRPQAAGCYRGPMPGGVS
jgi:hypothetical protein